MSDHGYESPTNFNTHTVSNRVVIDQVVVYTYDCTDQDFRAACFSPRVVMSFPVMDSVKPKEKLTNL